MDTTKRSTRWTDAKVAAQKLPPGKSEMRVLVAPGLYLHLRGRAEGSTAKHWQYRAQVDGNRRWLSLGAYPAVSLAKASEEMLRHRQAQEAAKKGEADHPVIVARFARKAALAQPTVAECFAEWLADKRLGSARKGGAPVRQRTIDVLEENFKLDIRDRIGDARVAKLTREALQACIDGPRRRGAPGAAAHVYKTLRGLTTFATKRGYITAADPMRGIENPKPYRPAPVVAASDDELAVLLRALASSGIWESTRLIIELQLLTGARPSEARMATWSEVDLDASVWVIPPERVKSGREFRVHLSAEAAAVFKRAERLRNATSDYVFPGAEGGALDKMAVARALARLTARIEKDGGKKLRPHDLRRTFRTLLARLGVQPHIAELCMNHQEAQTLRRVYDGHDYREETQAAWDLAGRHIGKLQALQVPMLGEQRSRNRKTA